MDQTSAARPPAAEASALDVGFILDEVASRYTTTLTAHKEAREYLASRGLDDGELMAGFKLGYCAGDLRDALSSAQKEVLVKLGLLKASGREHFAHCIVVPLFDDSDHVVGFYGRRIISN